MTCAMNINKRVLPPACDNYHSDKIDCFQQQACVPDLNYGIYLNILQHKKSFEIHKAIKLCGL